MSEKLDLTDLSEKQECPVWGFFWIQVLNEAIRTWSLSLSRVRVPLCRLLNRVSLNGGEVGQHSPGLISYKFNDLRLETTSLP